MIDNARFTLASRGDGRLLNDGVNSGCVRLHGARTRRAAKRSESDPLRYRGLSVSEILGTVDGDPVRSAAHHLTLLGIVQRDDGDVLVANVLPDVALRPVRQ